nr:retrotransposon protein, putative, unclassified [Tanacetum cinerariifolium]
MLSRDSVDTLLVEKSKLEENLQRKPVKATLYHGMIGSLMYLTSSRPDLTYAVCLCARYQAKPTKKHLNAVKRVFRYLKGTINMVLWAKHIDVLYHFKKEQVENGIVELYFVWTEYRLAYIFTKHLPREIFNFLIEKLEFRGISLTGFRSCASRSQTGASQSRQSTELEPELAIELEPER